MDNIHIIQYLKSNSHNFTQEHFRKILPGKT